MEKEDFQYIKKLVKERLSAMPPDVSFSVGDYGDFSPQDLINELCYIMDSVNLKNYFFSPDLFHVETLVATTPNPWGNYYNYIKYMKSTTGDIPYDTSVNLWLDTLKTEYTRIRHQ